MVQDLEERLSLPSTSATGGSATRGRVDVADVHGAADGQPCDSLELWVHLKRMGIPVSAHLADYAHADNTAEMVTKRTFQGWEAAMAKLRTLQIAGQQLADPPLVYETVFLCYNACPIACQQELPVQV